MNHIERLMARRQVDAEIKSDPVTIIPLRKTRVPDGAGGWVWSDPTPMEPVEALIAPMKRRLSEMIINTELGNLVLYPYILLTRHYADIERDDIFYWNNQMFQIKSLSIKTEVSRTALIDYFGGGLNA